jgi:myo-inositol-hexaphosphate 3-phosphohydrolase
MDQKPDPFRDRPGGFPPPEIKERLYRSVPPGYFDKVQKLYDELTGGQSLNPITLEALKRGLDHIIVYGNDPEKQKIASHLKEALENMGF